MGDNEDYSSDCESSDCGESGDSYTEVTSQSWGSRLMDSIKGVLVGVICFIVAFPVLWCNEGSAVKNAKGLTEGSKAVVSVKSDKVDSANNGKLVHMSGQATTDETLTDGVFNISENGIKLVRKVEMYQWKEESKSETKKKLGGGTQTVTKYTYNKAWSADRIDSGKFKKPGYNNPNMPYKGESKLASLVKIGAFRLSPALIAKVPAEEALTLKQEDLAKLPGDIKGKAKLEGGGIYIGASSSNPQVGDMKVSFSIVKPQMVSLLAKQNNDTFEEFKPATGNAILDLRAGEQTADKMFTTLQEENKFKTWIVRLIGFILMFAGLSMIFKPLVTVADVVPFLGGILSMGFGIVAFVVALLLSLLVIAIAWIAARPILAIGLIVVGVGVFVAVYMVGKKKKAAAA